MSKYVAFLLAITACGPAPKDTGDTGGATTTTDTSVTTTTTPAPNVLTLLLEDDPVTVGWAFEVDAPALCEDTILLNGILVNGTTQPNTGDQLIAAIFVDNGDVVIHVRTASCLAASWDFDDPCITFVEELAIGTMDLDPGGTGVQVDGLTTGASIHEANPLDCRGLYGGSAATSGGGVIGAD